MMIDFFSHGAHRFPAAESCAGLFEEVPRDVYHVALEEALQAGAAVLGTVCWAIKDV